MERTTKKALLEAALFAHGGPVGLKELKEASGLTEGELRELLEELSQEYRERQGGLRISQVAQGYLMHTAAEHGAWAHALGARQARERLSQAALEALAIVAYKQPITKAEVEALRGVDSDGVLRTLLERRLIKVVGRKEVPGKPLLYGTTREFLLQFGLKDLTELPTLKELEREP
mgnify:CR=1 FL=1|jgi:segregation and condensation protein B